jgi:hypothetical protein
VGQFGIYIYRVGEFPSDAYRQFLSDFIAENMLGFSIEEFGGWTVVVDLDFKDWPIVFTFEPGFLEAEHVRRVMHSEPLVILPAEVLSHV